MTKLQKKTNALPARNDFQDISKAVEEMIATFPTSSVSTGGSTALLVRDIFEFIDSQGVTVAELVQAIHDVRTEIGRSFCPTIGEIKQGVYKNRERNFKLYAEDVIKREREQRKTMLPDDEPMPPEVQLLWRKVFGNKTPQEVADEQTKRSRQVESQRLSRETEFKQEGGDGIC